MRVRPGGAHRDRIAARGPPKPRTAPFPAAPRCPIPVWLSARCEAPRQRGPLPLGQVVTRRRTPGRAQYDRSMITSVTLGAAATPTAPALVLRPWCVDDVAALVEASPDPGPRSEDDGLGWVRAQEWGWAEGCGSASPSWSRARARARRRRRGWWATSSSRRSRPARPPPRSATGRRPGRGAGVWPPSPGSPHQLVPGRLPGRRPRTPRTAPPGGQPRVLPRRGQVRLRVRQDPGLRASGLPARRPPARTPRGRLTCRRRGRGCP